MTYEEAQKRLADPPSLSKFGASVYGDIWFGVNNAIVNNLPPEIRPEDHRDALQKMALRVLQSLSCCSIPMANDRQKQDDYVEEWKLYKEATLVAEAYNATLIGGVWPVESES